MKNKYRIGYDTNVDELLYWTVSQCYPTFECDKWFIIARFHRRSEGRLFVAMMKEERKYQAMLNEGRTPIKRENLLWLSSAKLREISENLANARRMQGWT